MEPLNLYSAFNRFLRRKKLARRLFASICLFVIFYYSGMGFYNVPAVISIEKSDSLQEESPDLYAVFSSTVPSGESYRSFDYAFSLPLTAMAWERIGFKSVVIIAGARCKWENDPLLRLVLSSLEERNATVIFIESPDAHETMISQTSRIFTANMDKFPGKPGDFLLTTDADLWPIRKNHYLPRSGKDIVILHSQCCGIFPYGDKTIRMYPLSNIGAKVSVWRQIMNENHTIANDTESILQYYENHEGPSVRGKVSIKTDGWFHDQKMLSIRITEWTERYGNDSMYLVSDQGFRRLDRDTWYVKDLNISGMETIYDAHIPLRLYLPKQWDLVKPLINLMYGENSWQTSWSEKYFLNFKDKCKNYLNFGNNV